MIVVLDTTELRHDPWLRSAPIRILQEILRKSGAKLVIPDVVVREVQRHYDRDVRRSVEDLRRHQRSLNRFLRPGAGPFLVTLPDPQSLVDEHQQALPTRLREIGAEVPESSDIDVPALLDRALVGRRPFNEDGKKGFRDALIWERVLRLADGGDKVVLVTQNSKDFGDNSGLHPDLVEELGERGVSRDRVRVMSGLKDFNRREAEEHLQRLLDVEEKLVAGKHPKLSVLEILRNSEDLIADELDGNRDHLGPRLESLVDDERENIRVEEVTAVLTEHADIDDIDDIEVVKLDNGDASISFRALVEVELGFLSDAQLRTKHDFDDQDRRDHKCIQIEMFLEAVANLPSGEVRDVSITGW